MKRADTEGVPWTVKYRPRTLREVVGNRQAIAKMKDWLSAWKRGPPKKKALLIYGPPGVGKTVAVEAMSRDLGMELVESNASNYRREGEIKAFAGLASQYTSLSGKRRITLLDEIDGISGTSDKGGLRAVIKVIKNARSPIVLTANYAFKPKLATLRRGCLLLEFRKPSVREISVHLKMICEREEIYADLDALRLIAESSEGDVRSAVNDLQALAQGRKRLTVDDIIFFGTRDRKEVIFNVLRTIFYSRDCLKAKIALDTADVDRDMLFEWIYENAPRHFRNPYELSEVMNSIALADLYKGRILRTQRWSLLRYYIDFMTAGVTQSRIEGVGEWIPFRFPQRIKTLSATRKERQFLRLIGERIGRMCHLSVRKAIGEVLPYLSVIIQNDRETGEGIAKWLNLDDAMMKFLLER